MVGFSYSHSNFPSQTKVGRYCSIAGSVTLLGDQPPLQRFTTSSITYSDLCSINSLVYKKVKVPTQPQAITIENDVWIGDDVILKLGITIKNGAVIAAKMYLPTRSSRHSSQSN